MVGPKFDEIAQRFVATKDKKDHEIASLMDIDKSSWSSIKTGARYVPLHVIAECVSLFPGVAVTDYAEIVAFESQAS